MIGAIIGDIVGSRFEFDNLKSKDFDFFDRDMCEYTDDSILTLALAHFFIGDYYRQEIMESQVSVKGILGEATEEKTRLILAMYLKRYAEKYPHPYGGYGSHFKMWAMDKLNFSPYGSCGNGSAMRVSSVAYIAQSLEDVRSWSRRVTEITHNHPEGIKGAEATAVAIYLALHNFCKEDIQEYIGRKYYAFDFTLDEIRPTYRFDGTCQGTVSQALQCFFESDSFEDAIRNAISIGGDSDTLGAITGAIAGAYYGVSRKLKNEALSYLPLELLQVFEAFEKQYMKRYSSTKYLESEAFQEKCEELKHECQR